MKKFFVLGSGIGYSLSPTIFGHLFKIFGEKGEYSIVDVPDLNNLRDIIKGADGFNVTKPYKTEILRYLEHDKSECGSVNTVTVRDMTGYSTDGDGFIFDLERNYKGATSSKVLILGYGGAARACVTALKKHGADIAVAGRDAAKAALFAKEFGVKQYNGDFAPDGIVSCVSGTFVPALNSKPKFCYDLRYAGETLKLDCPSASGLGMLIAQAIYSYGYFMGKQFDNAELESVYLKLKETL